MRVLLQRLDSSVNITCTTSPSKGGTGEEAAVVSPTRCSRSSCILSQAEVSVCQPPPPSVYFRRYLVRDQPAVIKGIWMRDFCGLPRQHLCINSRMSPVVCAIISQYIQFGEWIKWNCINTRLLPQKRLLSERDRSNLTPWDHFKDTFTVFLFLFPFVSKAETLLVKNTASLRWRSQCYQL